MLSSYRYKDSSHTREKSHSSTFLPPFLFTTKITFVFGVEVIFALNFDLPVFHQVLIYISMHVHRNTYKDS